MLNNTEKNAILHKVVWKASERGKNLPKNLLKICEFSVHKLIIIRKLRFPPCPFHCTVAATVTSPLKAKLTSDGTYPTNSFGPCLIGPMFGASECILPSSSSFFSWLPHGFIFSLFIHSSVSFTGTTFSALFSSDTFFLGNYVIHFTT